MQDLCPVCIKNGLKRKIKAIQINLLEAVWMCEAEECVWPFGYENFIFLSRVVGKMWSCYWDNCNLTVPKKTAENVSIWSELPLEKSLAIPSEQSISNNTIDNIHMKNDYEPGCQVLEQPVKCEVLNIPIHNKSTAIGSKNIGTKLTVNTANSTCLSPSDKPPKLDDTLSKRHIAYGKQYEKFSFSSVKKKIKLSEKQDVNNIDNSTSLADNANNFNMNLNNINGNQDEQDTLHSVNLKTQKDADDIVPVADIGPLNNSAMDISLNVDNFLDDLLSTSHNISEDINDEWLNALLN